MATRKKAAPEVEAPVEETPVQGLYTAEGGIILTVADKAQGVS
jgi:acyl-coenzyme A thioesterase PaaI-like protein